MSLSKNKQDLEEQLNLFQTDSDKQLKMYKIRLAEMEQKQ